ncbi:Ionotropic receptor 256 [Frankliniella occidentalis]|nr:Ionotropic receptor 256 [Frankliniella occidentalis]
MSSDMTALFALSLCLAAVEASGNAVTVLTSRMVRQRRPEVPCALTLIPPLFQRADNDSAVYPPRLFVFGTTDWLDEFLQRFPSIATIYVFTTFEDFFLSEMMPSSTIVLRIAVDQPFLVPRRMRYIAWASAEVEAEDEAKADDWMSDLSLRDPCNRFVRMMFTIRPRGTTHVFSVPTFCDYDAGDAGQPSMAKAELLGVWSPGAGWSAPHVPIFPPLCASWRPPPDGEPLLAEMFIFGGKATTVGDFTRSEAYEILRLLRDSSGLVFQTKFRAPPATMVLMPFIAAETCRLDVLAFPKNSYPPVGTEFHSELSLFPWGLDHSVCVVPAGAGKPRHVLYPITAEYTPAVWAALAAVVLTVVTCLYLMRHDESVQELVLQTLSPLLGQPLRDRWTGPQIAVLGGWLLTCLVVVGAYQGQLLSFITVPPQNREINSWQDWLESDLVLLGTNRFSISYAPDDVLYGLTEDRLVRSTAVLLKSAFEIIATQRNASFIISKHGFDIESSQLSEVEEEYLSRTHTFVVNTAMAQSNFFTTKGSPFEKPLRKLLGRIHAAGGLRQNPKYKKYLPQATDDVPISLINVMPVLGVYIAGNIFAVFTFLLEFFLPTERKYCCI